MMWDLVRRVEGVGARGAGTEWPEQRQPTKEAVTFAAKVIGIGVFAGLMLTYCNVLIDACCRGFQ